MVKFVVLHPNSFMVQLLLATVTETQLQLISVVTEIESFLVTETESE